MILKYINPVFNAPHISTVSDAYVCKNVDENGNPKDEWILMINTDDEYNNTIIVFDARFSELCEMVNELYDNGKLDISSNSNISIEIFPRKLENMIQFDCDNEINLNDLFNDLGDDEDFYNE